MRALLVQWVLNRTKRESAGKEHWEMKVCYAVDAGMDGLKKLVVIVTLALATGHLMECLIVLSAFNLVRSRAFGLHADGFWHCLGVSVLLFVVVPMVLNGLVLNACLQGIWYLQLALLLHRFAPGDTALNPIVGRHHREKLKLAATRNLFLLAFISTFFDPKVQALLLYGATVSVVMVLPMTYKIFGRSRNNYERYELT